MTLLQGELFAGTGMLGRAASIVFDTRPGWFCEFDAAPSKVLAHHYPDVPNYGDVTKVDFRAVPHTHVRAGGFPCQDVSVSGARAGLRDGTRSGLWSEFARSIAEDRPDWVVIENVGGLLSAEAHSDVEPCPWCLGDGSGEPALRALGAVLADLAALGFDAEWTSIRASDIGAPHGRLRVFILAWPAERTTPDASSIGWDRRQGVSGDGREAPVGAEKLRDTGDGRTPSADLTLLPTPTVVMNDGESVESWSARRDRVKATGVNGNGMGMPLPIAVQLLPTPRTTDMNGAGAHGDGGLDLRTAVTLLPTPTVGNATGGNAQRGGSRSDEKLLPGIAVEIAEGSAPGTAIVPPEEHAYATECVPRAHLHASQGVMRPAPTTSSWGPYAAAIARWESVMGNPAPPPVRMDGKGGKARLNPELTEWMMGWPAGWVTSPEIGLSRSEQLKACGNGVVLQQAVAALHMLLARPGVPALDTKEAA